MTRDDARMTERIVFKAPESLPPLIDLAAHKWIMSRSDYVRQAVLDRLRADGVLTSALPAVAP